MTTVHTPNFLQRRAVILHRKDDNIRRLERQLDLLGMESNVVWPEFDLGASPADVVFYDGDNGYDGIFPWPKGFPPVPLIALISTEAPGRLEWILSQETSAHLLKPIQSSGVYSTLVIAFSNFERRTVLQDQLRVLEVRIAQRPAVFRAILMIMEQAAVGDDEAFAILRSAAMNKRQSIEDFCTHLDEQTARMLGAKTAADKKGMQ